MREGFKHLRLHLLNDSAIVARSVGVVFNSTEISHIIGSKADLDNINLRKARKQLKKANYLSKCRKSQTRLKED